MEVWEFSKNGKWLWEYINLKNVKIDQGVLSANNWEGQFVTYLLDSKKTINNFSYM